MQKYKNRVFYSLALGILLIIYINNIVSIFTKKILPNELLQNEVTILVPSCDKYSELWEAHFTQLFRFWPSLKSSNDSIPIILQSNFKEYIDPRVFTLKIGEDKNWSDNMIYTLGFVKTKYVLILLEDYIIIKNVNEERLLEILDLVNTTNALYSNLMIDYRMFIFGYAKEKTTVKKKHGIVYRGTNSEFRVNLQASIWNVEYLKKLLKSGESPWDFEKSASERSKSINQPVYSLISTPVFIYLNAAEQGVYKKEVIDYINAQNIPFYPVNLPIK